MKKRTLLFSLLLIFTATYLFGQNKRPPIATYDTSLIEADDFLNSSRANDIIAFGLEEVFESITTTDVSIAKLDDSHVVVAYQEVGFPPLGMAVVGTVSSNTISFGTSETFNAGGTDNISVTALGANYFVVAYQDDGASGLGYARVGSVFGSTISYDGLETNFYGKRPADEISVAALSSSVVVIAFNDIPFYGCAVVGHVSGSLLSFGSLYNFSSNTTSLCSVLALDATRFVVAYTDDTSSYSVAKQGTISGSSIVFGPAAPFANGSESLSTTKLSSSSFVVAYHDNSQPQVGSAIVGSVLGTGEAAEITFGPPNFFYNGTPQNVSATMLDDTHLAVMYEYDSNGYSKMGTISGTSISYGSEYLYNSASTNYASVVSLDACNFAVAFQDGGNSNRGTALIGQTNALIWDGSTDTDWNTKANWNRSAVPTSTDNVIIPAVSKASAPVIDIDENADCNNLTIESSGSLTIQSSASGTGSLIVSGTSKGDITVERYMTGWSSSNNGWHFLSSPVSGFTISGTDFVPTVGDDDLYRFDESAESLVWLNYNGGTFGHTVFEVGLGYLSSYETAATKSFSGSINTGTIAKSLSFTTSSGGEGWNLLGNPYTSAIDWDLLTKTSSVEGTVYVVQGSDGNYITWNGSTGDLTDGIIPAMQGYFAHCTTTDQTITMQTEDQLHNSTNFYKSGQSIAEGTFKVSLGHNDYINNTYIQFRENATKYFDGTFDGYKLFGYNQEPQIFTNDGETIYSINCLPTDLENYALPLNTKIEVIGEYQLSFSGIENAIDKFDIKLEDTKTGYLETVSVDTNYSFSYNEGDGEDRFILHFSNAIGVEENLNNNKLYDVYSYGNDIYIKNILNSNLPGTISVNNILGQEVYCQKLNCLSLQKISTCLNTGIYIVSLKMEGGYVISEKVIVK